MIPILIRSINENEPLVDARASPFDATLDPFSFEDEHDQTIEVHESDLDWSSEITQQLAPWEMGDGFDQTVIIHPDEYLLPHFKK